ncbi:MAG: AgmX/PglI C-terminal domain-containing protein [Kofleriaceae bacterium]
MSTALRTSLIWHDEVMDDVVHEKPTRVTLGMDTSATFTTPARSLPSASSGASAEFAIITPGRRGYVLTLSTAMSGTISVGGVEHDVAAFVAANHEGSGFHATTLGPTDWGVITLDASGDHKFFFQFVPHEVEDWNLGHPMILAGAAGYALSILALTLFWWRDGVALGEAAFRGASVASLAIGFAAIVRWAFRQNSESRASLAFSVLLHSAILLLTFQLYEKESPAVWPGPKSMTGTYLVKASDPPPEVKPTPTKPTLETVTQQPAVAKPMPVDRTNGLPPTTTKPWEWKPKRTIVAPKDKKKSGKEGTGLMAYTDLLDDITGVRGFEDAIKDLKRIDGDGQGEVPEFGAGDGKDTRGGDPDAKRGGPIGKATKKKGPLDTGDNRAEVCVVNCGGGTGGPMDIGPPGGSIDGGISLSKDDIIQVMTSRKGLFGACFQIAVNQGTSKGGDLVVRFVIDANGKVTSASTVRGSISGSVANCVKQKLYLLKFPAKGGAVVNHFPFVFTTN